VMKTTWSTGLVLSALCMVLGATAHPAAAAGLLDSLFGSNQPEDMGPSKERSWQLDEFTSVRLVDKEAGAPTNQHPVALNRDALRAQLAAVQVTLRGTSEPLFADAELAEITPALVRALVSARADDDVLLLSTARRGGLLAAPRGVTARLFVQGDALQLIVHDARFDFMEAYRRTNIKPKFVFGSRAKAGADPLLSNSASSKRTDWLAIGLGQLRAAPAAAAAVQAAVPAVPPVAAVPAAPAAAAPAPLSRAAFGAEQEERLVTLKRLRERNLITEEEYQQKRREILNGL